MTTLDFLSSDAAETKRPSMFAAIKSRWARYRQRRQMARALAELSYLDAHMLRDIGIEPLDVYDALNGRTRSILFNPMRRRDH